MRKKQGFTLMEMLIVIAIIAILIAIAIPLFTSQMDEAKRKADLANERSAYAAALAEWMSTSDIGTSVTYYYDNGALSKSAAGITGYGQSSVDASSFTTGVDFTASGVPNPGEPQYLTVTVSADGKVSMQWGASASFSKWIALGGLTKVNDASWWNNTQTRRDAFAALLASDNAARKAADIDTLSALANYFNGMSADEAQKILGSKRYGYAANGQSQELFEYNIDGAGSIRLNNFDTDYQPYFNALGFTAKNYNSLNGGKDVAISNKGYNYVDSFLFTSNEVVNKGSDSAGTHTETPNHVKISFQVDENNKLTNTKVWIDGLQADGYTSGS